MAEASSSKMRRWSWVKLVSFTFALCLSEGSLNPELSEGSLDTKYDASKVQTDRGTSSWRSHFGVAPSLSLSSFLVVNSQAGGSEPLRWPSKIAHNLTWCLAYEGELLDNLSPLFVSSMTQSVDVEARPKQRILNAMKFATSAWEAACDVRFPFVDGECDIHTDVWFRLEVSPMLRPHELGRAPISQMLHAYASQLKPGSASPWAVETREGVKQLQPETRLLATIQIKQAIAKSHFQMRDVLIHEIGHLLGFRHEHVLKALHDVKSLPPECTESAGDIIQILVAESPSSFYASSSNTTDVDAAIDSDMSDVTSMETEAVIEPSPFVDVDSVMMPSACGGRQTHLLDLSFWDKQGAKIIYGSPRKRISPATKSYSGSMPNNPKVRKTHSFTAHSGLVEGTFSFSVPKFQTASIPPPRHQWHPVSDATPDWGAFCNLFELQPIVDSSKRMSEGSVMHMLQEMISSEWDWRADIPRQCRCVHEEDCYCDIQTWSVSLKISSNGTVIDGSRLSLALSVCGVGKRFQVKQLLYPESRKQRRHVSHATPSSTIFSGELFAEFLPSEADSSTVYNITVELSPERNVGIDIDYAMYWAMFEPPRVKPEMGHLSTSMDLSYRAMNEQALTRVLSDTTSALNVTTIRLSGNKVGYLPPELSRLPNLKELEVADAGLSDLTELHTLSGVEVLHLPNNGIQSIPQTVSSLSQLRTIDLRENQLLRVAPDVFHHAEEVVLDNNNILKVDDLRQGVFDYPLKRLSISDNQLSSSDVFCGFHRLEQLKARHNKLTLIPSCVSNLARLKEMDLGYNELVECASELFQLPSLDRLDLSFNNLLHLNVSRIHLPLLRSFSLEGNQLQDIPHDLLSNLPRITSLDLSHNQLKSLPSSIRRMSKTLTYIDLRHNLLGSLPKEIGSLRRVSKLLVDHNSLTTLPPSLWSIPLTHIFARNNRLHSVPQFELYPSVHSTLSFVDLQSNELTSISETTLSSLTNLRYLSVSHNQLTTFPHNVSAMTSMLSLAVSHNQLRYLPLELSTLPSLVSISARSNRITVPFKPKIDDEGVINPKLDEIGFPSLQQLDLANNSIQRLVQGLLPTAAVVDLDLGHNRIEEFSPSTMVHGSQPSPLLHLNLQSNRLAQFDLIGWLLRYRLLSLSLKHNRISSLHLSLHLRVKALDRRKSFWSTRSPSAESLLETSSELPGKTLMFPSGVSKSSRYYLVPALDAQDAAMQLARNHPLERLDISFNRIQPDRRGKDTDAPNVLELLLRWFCSLHTLKMEFLGTSHHRGELSLTSNYMSREAIVKALHRKELRRRSFTYRECPMVTIPPYMRLLDVENVDFQQVGLTRLPSARKDDEFKDVRDFDLSYNALTHIPKWVLELPSLENLRVAGNKITGFEATMMPSPSLRRILASMNRLRSISPLLSLSSLQNLDVSYNDLESIPEVAEGQWGRLTNLDVSANAVKSFPISASMRLTELVVLDASTNHMEIIPDLSGLAQLKRVDLSRNFLTKITGVPSGVEILNLVSNELEEIITRNLTALKSLNLRYNRLQYIPSSLICASSALLEVNIGHNTLLSLPDCFREKYFGSRFLSFQCDHNALVSLPPSIVLARNARLNFAFNRLRDLPTIDHSNCSLSSLNLKENNLTKYDLQCSVTFLELDRNDITSIPASVFVNHYLRHLTLGHNKLETFPFKELIEMHRFFHTKRPSPIDLSFNRLRQVPKFIFSKAVPVRLAGNPLYFREAITTSWSVQSKAFRNQLAALSKTPYLQTMPSQFSVRIVNATDRMFELPSHNPRPQIIFSASKWGQFESILAYGPSSRVLFGTIVISISYSTGQFSFGNVVRLYSIDFTRPACKVHVVSRRSSEGIFNSLSFDHVGRIYKGEDGKERYLFRVKNRNATLSMRYEDLFAIPEQLEFSTGSNDAFVVLDFVPPSFVISEDSAPSWWFIGKVEGGIPRVTPYQIVKMVNHHCNEGLIKKRGQIWDPSLEITEAQKQV